MGHGHPHAVLVARFVALAFKTDAQGAVVAHVIEDARDALVVEPLLFAAVDSVDLLR